VAGTSDGRRATILDVARRAKVSKSSVSRVMCGGLVEAHDPQGEMFGFPRLRELVAEHGEERLLGTSF
jgi:Bacterial regulatory proteins, lacI family